MIDQLADEKLEERPASFNVDLLQACKDQIMSVMSEIAGKLAASVAATTGKNFEFMDEKITSLCDALSKKCQDLHSMFADQVRCMGLFKNELADATSPLCAACLSPTCRFGPRTHRSRSQQLANYMQPGAQGAPHPRTPVVRSSPKSVVWSD